MMSLRRTILIWITLLLAIVGAGATLASYSLAMLEADKLLDNELRQIAVSAGEELSSGTLTAPGKMSEDKLVIQIWNAAGEQTVGRPSFDLPRQPNDGFADIDYAGKSWRVYTKYDGVRTAQVAQRWSARKELARNAALGAALPIIGAIPIAWLAVFWGVNRLLRRLSTLAEAIGKRSVDAEDPIPLSDVPREIAPLIVAMNALIARHREAVDRQRRFVSDAAHELRTPLSALQIQVDNLKTRTKDKSNLLREAIEELNTGVRRASALVGQLLKMARLENAARPGHRVDIELRELVGSVVADHVTIAAQSEVDLGFWAGSSSEVRVSDPDAKLLFANLIDNAIRYTPRGGTVDVALKMDGADALVEVVDSGCGIPRMALPRVFDRFFRAAPPDIEGTGLGLAIAKAIADRNHFRLTIANRPGTVGVVVRVKIPCVAGTSARPQELRGPAPVTTP
jgi:two-component system, OmpR family, sensor kinase